MESSADPGVSTERSAIRLALGALVLGGAAVLVIVSVLGAVQVAQAPISATGAEPVGQFASFALDSETNAASAFSALLLLVAGGLALVLALMRPAGLPLWPLASFGAVFVVMGADEWLALHERLSELGGISNRLYYFPLAVLALVAWIVLWRGLDRYPPARTAWLAAPAAWLVSQVLAEVAFTSDGPIGPYRPVTIAEEVLEMLGSFLFGLAFVVVLAALLERRAENDAQAFRSTL